VKKQKFDREDARLLFRLMREGHFPQIWVPGPENGDLRQLLWHRHRLVPVRKRCGARVFESFSGGAPCSGSFALFAELVVSLKKAVHVLAK
jgi:hypothetical protein